MDGLLFYAKHQRQEIGQGGPVVSTVLDEAHEKKFNISEDYVSEVVSDYCNILELEEDTPTFKEYLMFRIAIDNSYMYPRGFLVKDKDRLYNLVHEGIPSEQNGQFWEINHGKGVNYIERKTVSSFIPRDVRQSSLVGLERRARENMLREDFEPRVLDPKEIDAISEDIQAGYSIEELRTRWGEYASNVVLDDLNSTE